jgi:hypothetical protein
MRSNSEELQREEKETRTFQKTGGGRNRRRRRRPARGSLSALFVHPRRRRHGHLFFCSRFQTAVVSLLRLHSLDATTRL